MILRYEFMQNAVIVSILVSIICGVMGPLIHEKKMLNLSAGLAHTAYGGVGLGYLLNFSPMLGAIIFSITSSLSIGYLRHKTNTAVDTLVSLFWSLGMALGIVFVSMMNEYPPNLNSYLFGNILSVSRENVVIMTVLTALVVFVIIALYNDFLAYIFDREFSFINGVNVKLLDYIFLILISLSVIVMINATGIILVLALLASPNAISKMYTNSLKKRMVYSSILSILFCLLGILISYYLDIPSGASIIILASLSYLVFFFINNHKVQNN